MGANKDSPKNVFSLVAWPLRGGVTNCVVSYGRGWGWGGYPALSLKGSVISQNR